MYKYNSEKIIILINYLIFRIKAFRMGCKVSFFANIYIHRGAKFVIGRGSRISHGAVISVLENGVLTIGTNVFINHNATIYCAEYIKLGDEVRVSHNCSIIDHDYKISPLGPIYSRKKASGIYIGKNVWVGVGVTILQGVTIGANSIIGANSLIRESIQPNVLACSTLNDLIIKELKNKKDL